MQLYNASALAVKAVDPSLKVGGPATAGLADLPAFVAACASMGLPKPDFVSSHHCASVLSTPSVPRGPPSDAAKKTVFFGVFNVCLSRACLGRMIIYIYKWLKKCRFLTCWHHRRSVRWQVRSDSNAASLPISAGLGPQLLAHPGQGGGGSGGSTAVSTDGV